MRSWLRAHRKQVIMATVLFGLFAIIGVLGYKASFVLKDDINLQVNGLGYLRVLRDSPFLLNYSFVARASRVCEQECFWSVIDGRSPSVVMNGSLVSKPGVENRVLVNGSIRDRGEGMVPFVFQVECVNRQTLACQSWGTHAYMSRVTPVEYVLGPQERAARDVVMENAPSFFSRINTAVSILGNTRAAVDELARRGLEDIMSVRQYAVALVDVQDSLVSQAGSLRDVWSAQDYIAASSLLKDMNASLGAFESDVWIVAQGAEETVLQYDAAVLDLAALSFERQQMADAELFYVLRNSSRSQDWRLLRGRVDALAVAPVLRVVKLKADIAELWSLYDRLRARYSQDVSSFNDELRVRLLVRSVEESLLANAVVSLDRLNGSDDVLCDSIPLAEDEPLQGERLVLREYALWLLDDSLNATEQGYFAEVPNGTLPNISMVASPLADPWLAQAVRVCRRNASVVELVVPETVGRLSVPDVTTIDPVLPEVARSCCALGVCRECCVSCVSREPVVFLHGHSFSERTTPLYSLNALGGMQRLLMEHGYLDAGVVFPAQEPSMHLLWAEIPVPVSVQASYYYFYPVDVGELTIRKDEGIENYALRVRSIIDIVRQRTGAEKVDIVAHSMGGLVAREYIALFGGQYVDDLVLIGTPNKGLVGRIATLCHLTGNSRECRDMESGSVFLENLNKQDLSGVQVTTIRAQGCEMGLGQGDGIVLESNAILEGAVNHLVNGTCTDPLKSDLHNNLIDPKKMPLVVNLTLAALD